jgi:hypothetical protein
MQYEATDVPACTAGAVHECKQLLLYKLECVIVATRRCSALHRCQRCVKCASYSKLFTSTHWYCSMLSHLLYMKQVLDSYVVVSAFTLVFLSPVGGLLCIGRIAVKAAAYILPVLGIRGTSEERALAAAAVRFNLHRHL